MPQIPFTIHIKVTPEKGKRFEYIRDLQKIGVSVLEEVSVNSSLTLASPGGGQHTSRSGASRGGIGGMTEGLAVKPQMGNTPAQLQITGFFDDSAVAGAPHPESQVVHTGSNQTGHLGSNTWTANPNTSVDDRAKAIRALFDTAVNEVLGSTDWRVFRLEVMGTIYGDRGLHFPR